MLIIDGNPVVGKGGIYDNGVYLSVFLLFMFYEVQNSVYVWGTVEGSCITQPRGGWGCKDFGW